MSMHPRCNAIAINIAITATITLIADAVGSHLSTGPVNIIVDITLRLCRLPSDRWSVYQKQNLVHILMATSTYLPPFSWEH